MARKKRKIQKKGLSIPEFIGEGFTYHADSQMIFGVKKGKPSQPIIQLRGYGTIHRNFDDTTEGEQFMDQIGNWIAKSLNDKFQKDFKK